MFFFSFDLLEFKKKTERDNVNSNSKFDSPAQDKSKCYVEFYHILWLCFLREILTTIHVVLKFPKL